MYIYIKSMSLSTNVEYIRFLKVKWLTKASFISNCDLSSDVWCPFYQYSKVKSNLLFQQKLNLIVVLLWLFQVGKVSLESLKIFNKYSVPICSSNKQSVLFHEKNSKCNNQFCWHYHNCIGLFQPKVITKDVTEQAQKEGKREGLWFYC